LWAPIPHFFFVCFAATLFLASFFRSFGNFVAGILAVLLFFMGISCISVGMVIVPIGGGKRSDPGAGEFSVAAILSETLW